MTYRNNSSPYPSEWSTAKLMRELNKYANLESFSWSINPEYSKPPVNSDDIQEVTRLYRQTWLQPIINELAKRLKVEL